MRFRIEQPRCLTHLRERRARDEQAGGQPASARAKGRWQVTRPEKRLCPHNRPRTATDPKALLAAVLSNLVSLNQNIYKIMSLATQISTRKQPSPGMFHLLFGAIPVPKVLVKPSFIPPHSARWLFALSFCFCCSTSV